MSDLISRDEAINAFRKELCKTDEHDMVYAIGFGGIERIINKLPTIEAEQVKQGKWYQEDIIKVYEAPKNIFYSVPHSYFLSIAQCSYCNCYSFNLHAFDRIKVDYGHCPNCGARMEQEDG